SFVGISLLTSGFFNAVQLTKRIKKDLEDIPVVWGGKHPTIFPEECLQYADFCFLGEADLAIVEFAKSLKEGEVKNNIAGMMFKENAGQRPRSIYVMNLNDLPFPDYGPEGQYVLENEIIREARRADIEKYLLNQYPTMIARGCPMKCTFCTNSAEDNRRLRIRSVDNLIAEILEVQEKYGRPRMIMFRDDTIMSLKLDYLEEFSAKWREIVRLPFSSSGVIPTAVKEDRLKHLIDAGFFSIKMGIQSGSSHVRKDIYWRPETDEQIMRAANIFIKTKTPRVGYMFITDNPWENVEDTVTSLRFIPKLPRPFSLSMYSLNLYPGTELFNRAVREGRITDPHEWYNKSTMTLKKNYFNMLYMWQRYSAVPSWLIRLLTAKALYQSKMYRRLFSAVYGWYFRNLTEYGVERKPVRPKTFVHRGLELFLDVFCRLDFKGAARKISRFTGLSKAKA
ncbi:MAG: B12-binding domain-containing radical SAM protein, partial [Candidatus Aminicenantes bacterium]|nr:B12-binding domain-containing radical SAM protein [Candidatus Aminicenantes bacterium]